MADPGSVRFKFLRLALDDGKAALRGWRFAMGGPQPKMTDWSPLAEFPCAIRQRPELGEQNRNRIHNMEQACAALDGRVIPPGQALSLRRLLGEPSEGRGYRPGPMLTGQRMGVSAGGGLCQISTALFNAALLADLEVLERHPHSSDPWGEARAFPLGLDATFVFARLDLKLRNPHPFPVQLAMAVSQAGDRLDTAFLSPTREAQIPVIHAQVLERIEPPGAEWMPGWVVETLRIDPMGRETYRTISRYVPTRIPGGAP